jgi:peptidyl-prolyl cis-trans isomerase C
MRQIFTAGLVAAALAMPTLAFSQAAPPDPGQVLARVNGNPITFADLSDAAQGLPEEFRGMPPQLVFPILLDQLISQRVVADAARAQGLDKDAGHRRRMARLEEETLSQAFVQQRLDGVLTESALRAKYQAEIASQPASFKVCARHVLVREEAAARAVIAELEQGGDFAAIASARSTDGSRAQGGDLGCFAREEMVAPFAEAAFTTEPGAFTKQPVQTQFGWHVIRVERREEQPRPTFEQATPQLRRAMAETAVNGIVEGLRNAATIERLDQPAAPARPPLDAAPPPPARR